MATLGDPLAAWSFDRVLARVGVGGDSLADPESSVRYYRIKGELHQRLLRRMDLDAAEKLPPDMLRTQLRELIGALAEEESMPINSTERDQLAAELQNEILGLGPLEPLLADHTISEIMVNGHDTVFIERQGIIERVQARFNDDQHLLRVIDKIVSRVGRRIDEASPMADARLPDGSRVNAIIPPVALDGPLLSIRRFSVIPLRMRDLIAKHTLSLGMARYLAAMVKARVNIAISGGTGSGKTTLLNILSGFIPDNERIVTIEDTAELQMQQSHVARLETRPPNFEGRGEITTRALVKNALRMRPDRIVLGEVRSSEVFDMLQAMNTGHDGSLTTIHANSARDALTRLENLSSMAGANLPVKAIREQISSAIQLIVQIERLSDGSRRVMAIEEVTGIEGDVITTHPVFQFVREGLDAHGKVAGRFVWSGLRPHLLERVRSRGVDCPDEVFRDLSGGTWHEP
ncbi:MAG: CpaF family protein [Betaproteobacteria bacterium]|jgi:pilus assembly protein CpaF|nr:CpaF family protein [Betaproteobacteria bacterium]NBS93159.1 CpaF family protein [Betaproteobacteria bacterium]NBT05404.1 CpaF family protein [Betaproteobacteria bacterium]NBU12131.1 CpaF family protein [Betaproteobacteria bacterium]NCA23620.1 CpaF family protein [Betaproteobacteria bacterium]